MFPEGQDWSEILLLLKNEDEFMVLQGVTQLQNQLAYAQEQQMQGFKTEEFMNLLCKQLNNENMSDFGDDIKFAAISCITNLIDLFPNVVGHLLNVGLIKGLTLSIQNSINTGQIDITQTCIRALEKVVPEAPSAVLRSGAIPLVMNCFDFLDSSMQTKIFGIIQKYAGQSQSIEDFNEHILPLIPMLIMNLSTENVAYGDTKKLEDACRIFELLQESFFNFIPPRDDVKRLSEQFNKLHEHGLYNMLLEHIRLYAAPNKQENGEEEKKQGEDGMQIDSLPAGEGHEVVSQKFILNAFRMIENAARFSLMVNERLFQDGQFLQDLCSFLPIEDKTSKTRQYSQEDYPFVSEVVAIFSALVADKHEPEPENQGEITSHQKFMGMKRAFENEKRALQKTEKAQPYVKILAENLLPRIFFVYEATATPRFRVSTLSLIDKVLALFDDQLLKECIGSPLAFSHFAGSMLKTRHVPSMIICLEMTKKILGTDFENFALPLIREGVANLFEQISCEENFKQAMGIRQDIKVLDESFDIEVHSLKERIHYLKIHKPEEHSQMDYCRHRLHEIYERQAVEEESLKKGSKFEPQPKSCEQLAKIFKEASALLEQYFNNEDALAKLHANNKDELNLMAELQAISGVLNKKANILQESMAQLKSEVEEPLNAIRVIFSNQKFSPTGYEFRASGLMSALVNLLTKTPRQLTDKNIEVNEKEGRCILYRFKLFVHIFLKPVVSDALPLQSLIELSHSVISENNSVFQRVPGAGALSEYHAPRGFGRPARGPAGSEFDHYVNALRQLQRRITVNMVYDPQKKFMKEQSEKEEVKEDELMGLEPPANMKKAQSVLPVLQSNLAGSPEKGETTKLLNSDAAKSKVEMLRHLLFTSLKSSVVSIEQSSCLQVLEDFLRNQVRSIDDVKALRQRELDGGLKPGFLGMQRFDMKVPKGSVRLANFFEVALQNLQSSMTQKMLRKSLTNGARKLLDQANQEAAAICKFGLRGQGRAEYERERKRVKKEDEEMKSSEEPEEQLLEDKELPAEEMKDEETEKNDESPKEIVKEIVEQVEVVEEKKVSEKVEIEQQPDEISAQEVLKEIVKEMPGGDGKDGLKYEFQLFGGEESSGAEGEDDQSQDSDYEEEAEIMREQKFAKFRSDFVERLMVSGLPEDQQHLLIKLLSKQHPYLIGFLHSYADGGDRGEDRGEDEGYTMLTEDEVVTLECRIDEFQVCMEELQDYFVKQKAEKQMPKKEVEIPKEDEEMVEEVKEKEEKEVNEDDESININVNDFGKKIVDSSRSIMEMLKSQYADQDKRIDRVLRKEQQIIKKLKKDSPEQEWDEAEKDLARRDLEDLIREEGEDVEFEFYFEGRPISNLSRSVFELFKTQDMNAKSTEKSKFQIEQLRILQERDEDLAKQIRKIQSTPISDEKIQQVEKIKKEQTMVRQLQDVINRELGTKRQEGLNSYRIYFCIKERKQGEKRQRLDSLAELTGNQAVLKRQRTMSQAVKDLSSDSIDSFVQQILSEELRVLDEPPQVSITNVQPDDKNMFDDALTKLVPPQQEEEKKASEKLQDDLKAEMAKAQQSGDNTKYQQQERLQLEQALKLLKLMSFLTGNKELLTSEGMQFLMRTDELKDFDDLDLQIGSIQNQFQHAKLDHHLQRSLKDPINLVQGISPTLQQIFANCPFLFPFTTKQLYFKLVSFLSSIDVNRSIYFLHQHIKTKKGAAHVDQLKKVGRQKVQIHRDNLIKSAAQVMQKIDKKQFLEFEFQGDAGTGLGPTLEFYDNIADEFKSWSIKEGEKEVRMWRTTMDNDFYPAPLDPRKDSGVVKEVYEVFRLCGQIIAKAIVDDRQIDLSISPLFWRLCMGGSDKMKMSIFDVKTLDEGIYKLLSPVQILANQAADLDRDVKMSDQQKKDKLSELNQKLEEIAYGLPFTLPNYDHIELIENGSKIEISIENAQDYIDMILNSLFHETVKIQVQAFRRGFNQIFPVSSLQPFLQLGSSQDELEHLICGMPCSGGSEKEWTDPEEQFKFIIPDHGYTRNSAQYNFFLRYIREIPKEQRSMFIKFLTGSKRLPLGGFRALQPNMTVVKKTINAYSSDEVMPSVMACQNYVKIPAYSTYEILKQKFDYAVENGQQQFMLS